MNYDELSIGYMLNSTASYFRIACLQMMREKGFTDITPEQFGVLFILYEEDGKYQRQLAQLLTKDRPNITRIIDILVDNKFVVREKSDENRRISRIFITQSGREIVGKILPYRRKLLEKTTEGLSKEELSVFFITLKKIRENLAGSFNIQI